MIRICSAKLLVDWVPFKRWNAALGQAKGTADLRSVQEARQLAADVEWAAKRLPFATKCLPRGMALSWTLRRRQIPHSLVIAVRPSERRNSPDALHAWVEVNGQKILGDLPGPWIETARLSG